MNHLPLKKIGILLCAAGLILTGMITTLYALIGLIAFEKAEELLHILPTLNAFIFYSHVPESWRGGLLAARLILAVLQITVGVCLITRKPWALRASRIFLMVFMVATFFNPYYPDILILLITTMYMAALFYLNHHSAKEVFFKEEVYPQSSSILILGCLETLLGLGLTRWAILMPDTGSLVSLTIQAGMTLTINIPKASAIFLCLLLVFIGLTTLAYKPTGRICNNILCVFFFFTTCAVAMFVRPPGGSIYRILFLVGIIITLITTSSFYFLFTNPQIKLYFHSDKNIPWRRRFLHLIAWGAACSFILVIIQKSLHQFPNLFDPSPANPLYSAKMDSQKRQQDFLKKLFP